MENLEEELKALIEKYGASAVVEAVKSHKVTTDGVDCPQGYYKNSNGDCVLNVG